MIFPLFSNISFVYLYPAMPNIKELTLKWHKVSYTQSLQSFLTNYV